MLGVTNVTAQQLTPCESDDSCAIMEERLCRRQKEIAPLVGAYFAWAKEQNLLQIGSKKTCDGLAYSLNQEKQLRMFLRDGEIPADNSASERTIRPFTVGRKNWMMLNTPRGHNPVQFYTALQKQPRPIS